MYIKKKIMPLKAVCNGCWPCSEAQHNNLGYSSQLKKFTMADINEIRNPRFPLDAYTAGCIRASACVLLGCMLTMMLLIFNRQYIISRATSEQLLIHPRSRNAQWVHTGVHLRIQPSVMRKRSWMFHFILCYYFFRLNYVKLSFLTQLCRFYSWDNSKLQTRHGKHSTCVDHCNQLLFYETGWTAEFRWRLKSPTKKPLNKL